MTTTPLPKTGPSSHSEAATYQIRVAGHLDDHWSEWLGCHNLNRNADSTTTLTLIAADQAHVHGVLAGVRDLGVTLLALNRVD